jgi:hypothetical protein
MTKLDTLKQQTAEMEAKLEETTEKLKEMKEEIERLEGNRWKMKCPYKEGDEYYFIYDNVIDWEYWEDTNLDTERFDAGNVFPTEEAALLEAKRRYLLTRFNAFRDECNNGWEPDWSNHDRKWSISKNEDGPFETWAIGLDTFSLFGYFKNEEDCKKAIDLFSSEIKELFM